jgi:hypothetical protein
MAKSEDESRGGVGLGVSRSWSLSDESHLGFSSQMYSGSLGSYSRDSSKMTSLVERTMFLLGIQMR